MKVRIALGFAGGFLMIAMIMILLCCVKKGPLEPYGPDNPVPIVRGGVRIRRAPSAQRVMTVDDLERNYPEQFYGEWREEHSKARPSCVEHNGDATADIAVEQKVLKADQRTWSPPFILASHLDINDKAVKTWISDEEAAATSPVRTLAVDSVNSITCAICLEAFEDDSKIRALSCIHVFHSTCSEAWLTNRSCRCPVCRVDCLEPVDSHPIDEPPAVRLAPTPSGQDVSMTMVMGQAKPSLA